MKAERRRELKTNTLAQGLENLPLLWRVYGGKILAGLVVVLAIVLFIQYQRSSAQRRQVEAEEALGLARRGVSEVQFLSLGFGDPRTMADQRQKLTDEVERAVAQVLADSKTEAHRAEAQLLRGDLNWHTALSPDLRTAGSQPTTKPNDKQAKFLDLAQQAYEAAAQNAGAKPITITSARFGLAAIAEQRGRWDDARAMYERIINDSKIEEIFKFDARTRLESLENLRKPVLIGQPMTQPASTMPATTRQSTTTRATTTTTTSPTTAAAAK